MAEIVASAFALRGGSDAWLQASWRSRVAPLLPNWPMFRAVLLGPRVYAPDFLTPAPRTSRPTLADELAGAAEIVMRKTAATPVAIIRGAAEWMGDGSGRMLVREAGRDLFR